ncbi:hypothetical protein CEXT_667051 [Caerostris extrusa]|uniref:Uncharacterized protein n=1 Tax=Caerostris extrusa TaxID=172846 RepID=A0AAV4NJQ6_CAEEX|nr:hypothetical protein CEXT_667051 [Caerostris extrusa]
MMQSARTIDGFALGLKEWEDPYRGSALGGFSLNCFDCEDNISWMTLEGRAFSFIHSLEQTDRQRIPESTHYRQIRRETFWQGVVPQANKEK